MDGDADCVHFIVRLEFPRDLRSIIESTSDLDVRADYVDGPVDHLGKVKFGNSYEFGQAD